MGWTEGFEKLRGLDPALLTRLEQAGTRITAPAGMVVFGPGAQPEQMMLVLDGCVRVQHVSEGGRQIVLYRVQGGESCIMTTACLMAHEAYAAEGIVETQTEAVTKVEAAINALRHAIDRL